MQVILANRNIRTLWFSVIWNYKRLKTFLFWCLDVIPFVLLLIKHVLFLLRYILYFASYSCKHNNRFLIHIQVSGVTVLDQASVPNYIHSILMQLFLFRVVLQNKFRLFLHIWVQRFLQYYNNNGKFPLYFYMLWNECWKYSSCLK